MLKTATSRPCLVLIIAHNNSQQALTVNCNRANGVNRSGVSSSLPGETLAFITLIILFVFIQGGIN